MTHELERALAGLEALEKRRGRPTRHDARALLLELGRLLGEGPAPALEAARSRVAAWPPSFAEDWEAAVRDEVGMAVTEYVRSMDPRHLDHPQYDWEYTLEARERLTQRMRAIRFLGIPTDGGASAGMERADRLLAARRPEWSPNP